MIWPLTETLERVKPYVPHRLVTPQTFDHIQTLASLLPEAMSAYYIECRLAAGSTQVDFSTCVLASKGGREILAGPRPAADLPSVMLQNGVWRRVREFLADWASPDSPLYKQIPFIWLEFDGVNESQAAPLPCLNFCLDPGYLDRRNGPGNFYHPNTQRFQPFAEIALAQALGHSIEPRTRQNLVNCFDQLPEGGRIIYMAVMIPRQPAALKINVVLPQDRLLGYLTRVGWTGEVAGLKKVLTTFCDPFNEIRFDLTVGSTIWPRIGLEFFAHTAADVHRQLFLEQLVAAGLCAPEKQAALLSWPGSSSEIYSRQSHPTRLSRSWYVKLVYQGGDQLEAKGYLGFAPSFFSLFALA